MPRRIATPDPSELPATADLVIIGGGIVGAATAFFAGRAGLSTIVLESRPALATLNTTRSLEGVRAQFDDPDDIAMMRESLDVFERFGEVIGVPGYEVSLRQQGYLFLSQGEAGAARIVRRVAAQRAAGLHDVELLSGEDACRRFPWLAADVTAAAFRARDGWVASHEVTYGFAGAASRARFFLETPATRIDVSGGRVAAVQTPRGPVATRAVVVAAGPFSLPILAAVGIALPLQPVRRHRAGIRAHPLVPRDAPMTISLDTGAHFRPEGPGAYFGWSGALEEAPGPPLEDVPADWTFPALALDACARFAPFWARIGEELTRDNVTVQAGQYDLTPDARPLIGPAGGVEGLHVHTGYSGHGVMGSPGGARLCVDVLTGRVPAARNPFRLSRFAEGPTATKVPL